MKNNKNLLKSILSLFILLVTNYSIICCGSDDEPSGTIVNSGTTQQSSLKIPASLEAVDLGLSVKWASVNIGGEIETDAGAFFVWGEVEGYENDNRPSTSNAWEDYKYAFNSEYTMTKYCTNAKYGYNGFTDNKTVLDIEDDAAYFNWGGKWRIPTDEEFKELFDKTINTHTRTGMKFTSKTNPRNYIFFPFIKWTDAGIGWGTYWTSTLSERSNEAIAYTAGSPNALLLEHPRIKRCMIRAVCK